MMFLRVQIYTNALVLDFLSRLHRDPYSNLGVVAEFFFFGPLFRNELLTLTPPPPMTSTTVTQGDPGLGFQDRGIPS